MSAQAASLNALVFHLVGYPAKQIGAKVFCCFGKLYGRSPDEASKRVYAIIYECHSAR